MSTFALAIGLVVGNLVKPGEGLHLTEELRAERAPRRRRRAASTVDFLLGIIPTSLFSALTSGEVLQTLLVALLVGFALQAMGAAGKPVLRGVEHLQRRRLPGAGDDHVGRARSARSAPWPRSSARPASTRSRAWPW